MTTDARSEAFLRPTDINRFPEVVIESVYAVLYAPDATTEIIFHREKKFDFFSHRFCLGYDFWRGFGSGSQELGFLAFRQSVLSSVLGLNPNLVMAGAWYC
jgi:hypothetical protein